MSLYIKMINQAVDYIDENLSEPLGLQDISQHFYLSEYHFSRIFKILTGTSLKQYVLGRKLALAAKNLQSTEKPVIDIAYECGFEYTEVFSRAFKKQFGISPAKFRDINTKDSRLIEMTIPKAEVVDRDIANYKGSLTLKETCKYFDAVDLAGIYIEVDENADDFENLLKTNGERFFCESIQMSFLDQNKYYSVVNCHEDDSGKYTVFFGRESLSDSKITLESRPLPSGWYACFAYYGDMAEMRSTFVDDFYRWIMIKGIELNSNGIGMVNIYDAQDTRNVNILIPIKPPK